MPPAPTFGRIPKHLWNRKDTPLKDTSVIDDLSSLDYFIRGRHRGHAHGTWGYTILRTAYGDANDPASQAESDVQFRTALDRLHTHVEFWCNHCGRFSAYGALCESRRVDYDEPNQELVRRFYVEANARFEALGEYFRGWVARLEDTGNRPEENPRFTACLVLDSESVASLAALPAEVPPLRCAVDLAEKREFLGTSHGAWMWLIETDYDEEGRPSTTDIAKISTAAG